ncbi:MAG: FlgD immunoglobulin-like domain containing protein [bacterium]
MRRFQCVPWAASLGVLLGISESSPAATAGAWRALPIQQQAQILKVAVATADPARLFAWGGILYRSSDGGASWALLPGHFGDDPRPATLETLAFDPLDSGMGWASVRNRIFQSTDFGETWAAWGTPLPGERIRSLLPNVGSLVSAWAATTGGPAAGVYHTTDGGMTWLDRGSGLVPFEVRSLGARPTELTTLVAGTANGLARTTDEGLSWLFTSAGPPGAHVAWSSSGAIVRAQQAGLVQSTDAGATWSLLRSQLGEGEQPYAFDPEDAAKLLVSNLELCAGGIMFCTTYGYQGSIQRSTDSGASWTPTGVIMPCQYVDGEGYNVGLAGGLALRGNRAWNWLPPVASSDHSIMRSLDGGAHWAPADSGMYGPPIGYLGADGAGGLYARSANVEWGHVAGHRCWRSLDGGRSWQSLWGPLTDVGAFEVARERSGDLLDAGMYEKCDVGGIAVFRSTDGGSNWFPPYGLPSGLPGGTGRVVVAWDYGPGSAIYLWPTHPWNTVAPLYRSGDGNQSYTFVGETFVPRNAWIAPENVNHVFALARDGDPVRFTTDGGVTWTSRSAGLPAGHGVRLLMDPADGEHLALAFERGVPWESTNGGRSWSALPLGASLRTPAVRADGRVSPAVELRDAIVSHADWEVAGGQRRVFLATDRGVWISDVGFVDEGLPRLSVDQVVYSRAAGVLAAGAEALGHVGFGAFALDLPPLALAGGPTEASVEARVRSTELVLAPNPFARSLGMQFALPAAGPAHLTIFDAGGRRVRTIVDARLAAGTHAFRWDARDDSGREVVPGVYFVRLQRDGAVTTGRAILVR